MYWNRQKAEGLFKVDRRCQCNYIDHEHGAICGNPIKSRYYFHRAFSWNGIPSNEVIVVCTKCHQLLRSAHGKIY